MKNDGKIYIIVTDKLPAGGDTPAPAEPVTKEKKEDLFSHWARQRLLGEAKQLAQGAVMYSLHNIGNFTGDYITQAHVNNAMSAVSGLASIGTAALAGFKYTGSPIGAVIAASIAVINKVVSGAQTSYSNYVQNQKTNYEIEQLRERSGLNTLVDGSRGTEN